MHFLIIDMAGNEKLEDHDHHSKKKPHKNALRSTTSDSSKGIKNSQAGFIKRKYWTTDVKMVQRGSNNLFDAIHRITES